MDDSTVMTFGEFRKHFNLCPVGHHKGWSSEGPDYCYQCEFDRRKKECTHDYPRSWYNPSNLPGDNRFQCNSCGKGGLPPRENDEGN